jgi:hypothetical protein
LCDDDILPDLETPNRRIQTDESHTADDEDQSTPPVIKLALLNHSLSVPVALLIRGCS